MRRLIAILLLCLVLVLPCAASAAVFNLARDYIPAPPGTLAILTYYQFVSAQYAYVNGTKVTNDLGLNEHIGLFRPVYWLKAGPLIIDPQFIIPFGYAAINQGAGPASFNTSSTGFGDPLWFATFWFLHNDDTKTYVGFTPILITPLGTYNSNKAINLGANRWSVDLQLGGVKGFTVMPGHNIYFEAQVHGQFYTNNTDALNPGILVEPRHGTLSQNPELDFEGHVSYDITKTAWASFDYYGALLGEQKFNGVALNNSLSNHSLGVTVAYSFAPGYQLALQYRGDVATLSGPQTNIITARFLWATDLKSLGRVLTK
jgi:hypothetical protein